MEKTVEAYLRDTVRAHGGVALKFVSPGQAGVPDRLVLLPGGVAWFAETKDAGRRPTPRQVRVHERLRALGFRVFIPDSKAAVDRMMEEMGYAVRPPPVPELLH